MLKVCKVNPDNIFGNWIFGNDKDFSSPVYVKINNSILQLKPVDWIPQGFIGLNIVQRNFLNSPENNEINFEVFNTPLNILQEVNLTVTKNNTLIKDLNEEQRNKYKEYIYYALYMTCVSSDNPSFLIPDPFNDEDVIVINVQCSNLPNGLVNDNTNINFV